MRGRVLLMTGFLLIAGATAARADVCVTIDETRDMLSPRDRVASILLVKRQFEFEGEAVTDSACDATYTISHVKLGATIVVTLSGPNGKREGVASGMEDLPALYSQMVRSIVTGRPMSGFNVTDRTNVTEAQSSTRRVHTDSFSYARLGYGGTAHSGSRGGPAIGFGQRIELDTFGIDVSFFNYQIPQSNPTYTSGYYEGSSGASGSLLKLEGLYFLKPTANASGYVGGGLSWGMTRFSEVATNSYSSWSGSGLQGELTVGYELPRASSLRLFVQADAGLPFYKTTSQRYNRVGTGSLSPTIDSRYTPTLSVSVGLGWQRHRP